MCLNPECKWITIIEDDKSGKKCFIHYKFAEDGSFEELFTEGDKSLKIYVDMMRDNKYFLANEYPRAEVPHNPDEPKPRFVLDCACNILDMEQMQRPIVIDDIVDLDDYIDYTFELSQPSNFANEKNPAYKSSNGY